MILGFTGSRHGMTHRQHNLLGNWLKTIEPREVHHGDCVGSDAEFHALVRQLLPKTKIVIHPPLATVFRAFCKGDEERDPAPYLVRDEAIIEESEHLLATPDNGIERKGGTWYTINFADKLHMNYVVFYPNGTIFIRDFEGGED
jgi:hypothetical protein